MYLQEIASTQALGNPELLQTAVCVPVSFTCNYGEIAIM